MIGALARFARTNAVGLLALFVALGGTGYGAATLPKNSIGAKQLKPSSVTGSELKGNAVTSKKVKDHSLLAKDFKSGQLPQGATGKTGDQGPAGTARAYVYVNSSTCATGACSPGRSKNVTAVTRLTTGRYCITAPGLDPATTPGLTAVEFQNTDDPETLGSAHWRNIGDSGCPGGLNDYEVVTQRENTIEVRDSTDSGSETVVDVTDTFSDTVSFSFMVP